MSLEGRTFNFVASLTGVVILVLLGATVYALIADKITFDKFAQIVVPPATGLVGYWVRGLVK